MVKMCKDRCSVNPTSQRKNRSTADRGTGCGGGAKGWRASVGSSTRREMGESAPATPGGRGSPGPDALADVHRPTPALYTPMEAPPSSCEGDEQQPEVEKDRASIRASDMDTTTSATQSLSAVILDTDSDSDMDYSVIPRRPRVRHPAGGRYKEYIHHDDDDDGDDVSVGVTCVEPASPTVRTPLVPTVQGPEVNPEMGGSPALSGAAPPYMLSPHYVELAHPAYIETGLPILLTPLTGGTKSETCSYILPPTAGCSRGGAFDTKSETNSVLMPLCRICHVGEEEGELISPCRCSGTLQHIHNKCLMRWLEILSKKSRKPPKCELCHFQYHRHKKFKFHHWRVPRVSRQDKVLHIIFLVNLVMMIGCAVATVMSFLSDKGSLNHTPPGDNVELSTEEIITLSCGVLFFVSFFIAMSVQIKAKHTIYQLLVKFIMQNMEWEIDEYDKSKDTLYKDLYKGLPVYV